MFREIEVPVLGIVENMSYFVCPDSGKQYDIFGHGGGAAVAEQYDLPLLGEIPIDPAIRRGRHGQARGPGRGQLHPGGFLQLAGKVSELAVESPD